MTDCSGLLGAWQWDVGAGSFRRQEVIVFTHIFEMLPVDAAKQLASPASAVLAFWPGPSCLPDCCHLFGLQRVCRILGCTC